MNDYYEILGVARDASQEEIKKAYRKKARLLHPDYAGPDSEEAFKELSVAYETLSDPEKRQMYDIGGPEALRGGAGAGSPFGAGGFGDIFDAMFGGGFSTGFSGGGAGQASRVKRGKDQRVAVDITLEEATFGAKKDVKYTTYATCETCGGDMCQPGTQPVTCSTCSGSGFITRVQSTLFGRMQTQSPCAACQGFGTTIPNPCSECAGKGRVRTSRTITVDIPAGADEGTQIRATGQAEVGEGGGPNGDLYLLIREKKHPIFDRRGDDLHTWITIPMTTAALGTEFELDTLDGKKTLTIKAGTQPHDDIVLDDLGVGRLQRQGRGDLHVHIDVEIPKKLDAKSRELLEELAALRQEVRFEPHRQDKGFFDRLRDTFGG
ncbi:molecular chaperone DnaJ [Schaalia vaccimaxillae]|uniref:molecular chaperone DnaJ n=1 Tax=Schaalia vaccimaxillae TaxID=183916 RepID=UPI0003B35189|nr:J domain-containing protein [Schaalia vaccimaxillae]